MELTQSLDAKGWWPFQLQQAEIFRQSYLLRAKRLTTLLLVSMVFAESTKQGVSLHSGAKFHGVRPLIKHSDSKSHAQYQSVHGQGIHLEVCLKSGERGKRSLDPELSLIFDGMYINDHESSR